MIQLWLRRLVCALAIGLAAHPAVASTVIYRTDAELIALSDRVVHGRVIRQRVERPEPDGAIYTVSTIAVLEDLTGVTGSQIDVWELGGTYGDETMWVGGRVTYEIGSNVVLCLERGRFGLRSVAMGFSTFVVDPVASADGLLDGRLTRNASEVSIIGAPAIRQPGLSLAEFRELAGRVRGVRAVRNREADLAAVETGISSGFTFLDPRGFRWTEADSGTPVNWYINTTAPAPLTSGDGVAELQLALSAWTAPASASIILQYAGTTNQVAAPPNGGRGPWSGIPSNSGVVTFEDPNNEISGSTLAIGGGFGTSGGGTVNGMSFLRFTRGYVIWANAADLSASFRQSTNFARVMEHEIGHTIGLGHSDAGTANIMYFSCCVNDVTPVAPALGPDDLAGLNFIYPAGTSQPPPPNCMYSIAAPSASLPAAAGSGSVGITAGAGCSWTTAVASGSTFLSITSGSSGTGNGTVGYAVLANTTTSARTGTLSIQGQTFTVTQAAGACGFTLSAITAIAPVAGGSASVGVTANGSNCAWTATTSDSFVTITSGASGTGSGTVGYTLAPNGAVTYRTATILIAGQTFTITQAGSGPSMSLDRSSLYFGAESSGTTFLRQTSAQTVRLTQSGSGTVSWVATSSVPWITVSPASGTGSATLTVRAVFVNGLPGAGSITGAVSLVFTGAGLPAAPLTVGLNLYAPNSPTAPTGAIDTPADGITGVTGSIAVTGWAVDDIEVTRVRILRDPVPGEAAGLIPIGDAVFVDGSRTDIAALFPITPRRTRAGWGYLMLTNFLPALGNGTFRIHAYADDPEGRTTLLGTRTITCTNDSSVAPFGAIDTPDQGATISGAAYNNFGWVLARGGVTAYPPAGTVTVLVDGVNAGSPTGWTSRPDLTSLFPPATYPGVTNALGVATLNTTALSDGLHTIAWIVTASNGQAAGIGSRYFTVQNAGASIEEAPASALLLDAARQDRSDISARRGYDLSAPFRRISAASGPATIHGEEMDRFEIALGAPAAGSAVHGYLRGADGLTALPPGANLDSQTGVFTWQPGVGFVHDYDFVFVRLTGASVISRQDVRVVIHPKGSNRVGPQITIDVPANGSGVAAGPSPLLIAGWAIDADADSGTGVDTVHVWAYPKDGGDPVFLGAAAYGGSRPDVAAIHGPRFRDSGYGLLTGALPAGTYDIAVFAWSTVTGDFVPARLARVTVR